jgi:type VI secretion system Hcp family effector
MGINALMRIEGAQGESRLEGFDTWIELQSWDWDVEAESSWTKGGGASVGKPNPGKMNWEHYYDKSSPSILRNICSGTMFEKMELKMFKSTGATTQTGKGNTFFHMIMLGVFITKVANSATEEGNVVQKVEMVFKTVEIIYKPQDNSTGKLGGDVPFSWDIQKGKVG